MAAGQGQLVGRVPNALVTFTDDFKRLQNQKHRRQGGVEARILLNLAMYFGEQAAAQDGGSIFSRIERPEDKNRLQLVFSMIKKMVRKKSGRLWSIDHQFTATPDTIDPVAYDKAEVADQLLLGLNRKLKEYNLAWIRYFWLMLGGVVIEHTPWIMEAGKELIPQYDDQENLLWTDNLSGQVIPQPMVEALLRAGQRSPESFSPKESLQLVGDVGAHIISPLNFFIEASTTSIRGMGPSEKCYIAEIKTVDWIVDNFGTEFRDKIKRATDLSIVKTRFRDTGPALANMSLNDLIPALQGSQAHDDPPMAMVVTAYQPPSDEIPGGCRHIFVPEQCTLDYDDLPYEEIPLTDIHWEPNATTFWTPDFVTDLVPAQKFLNKRVSQLGESANSTVYEILLLGGSLSKDDVPTDLPGVVEDGLDENGQPKVVSLQRAQLPGWFLETIRFVLEFMQSVGGSDLMSSSKFPGQLRGTLSAPILQELMDSEDGPFYSHLGEQLAQIHQMRLNRVKQYYEPIRTLHYTGKDLKDEVLIFHADDVLRAGFDFFISVDRKSITPELSALREARVNERLSGPMAVLYLNPRTGKIDPSKIAQDLKYTDRFRVSQEAQYRKLGTQLIGRLWRGEPLDPRVPLPFWDHEILMDELERAMATTEFMDASPEVIQNFISFHEKCRQFLAAIHDQAQQAMDNKLMQGAMAQAAQQTAAKAASVAAESALEQIFAQADFAQRRPMVDQLQEQMGAGGAGGGRLGPGRQQPARALPPKPIGRAGITQGQAPPQ